jgi:hypothetical protein
MADHETISVTFATTVQAKARRFTVPEEIVKFLGLHSAENIALTIHTPAGRPLFHGIAKLSSGVEIYGAKKAGRLLEPGMAILVTASIPPKTSK